MNEIDAKRIVGADLADSKQAAYEATFRRFVPPAFATLSEERRHRKDALLLDSESLRTSGSPKA